MQESNVPEQFKNVIKNGQLVTEIMQLLAGKACKKMVARPYVPCTANGS